MVDTKLSNGITALQGGQIGTDSDRINELVSAKAKSMAVWFIDQKNSAALLLKDGERDGVTRWRSVDNRQIYTRDGIVIATRGFSDDLMTADVPNLHALVTSLEHGQVARIERHMDGEDKMQINSWICDISAVAQETIPVSNTEVAKTTRIDENCHGPSSNFSNSYWVQDGRVIQGIQQISPGIGRMKYLFVK